MSYTTHRGLIKAALSILLITAAGSETYARQLSPEEALLRACRVDTSVMNTMGALDGNATPRLEYTATTDDGSLNTLYIFNCGTDRGYMLVSADDDFDAALLGYSASGSIDASEMPDNMRWWISQYSREIAMASTRSGRAFDYGDFEIPELPAIAPIVKTHWKQGAPYNLYCPAVNGTNTPTGCVATAMGQIMKVHDWPEHGTGTHSYHSSAAGKTLTANFADSTYRWDLMLNSYTTSSDPEAIAAVASLMSSCGIAVSMQYALGASSASYTSAAKALVSYFDYDKGMRILHRDYYGIQDWFDLLYSELKAGRPVLYSGTNESAGHAFVCDGYDKDGYFHINWGWGGSSDGYYLLTAMNPYDQGIGGSSDGYNNGQTMIVGIQPPVEGSEVIPVIEFNSNFQMAQNGYSRSDATVHVVDRKGIFCQSVSSLTATMGLKITDSSGNISYVAGTAPKAFSYGQAITGYNVDIDKMPQAAGEYEVAPAVMDEEGKWWDCDVKMTQNRYINMRVTADSLLFTPTTVARVTASEVEVLSPIYPGLACGFRAVLTNNSDEEFYEKVAPTLVLNHVDKGQCDPLSIELMPGQSGVFEWRGDFPSNIQPGEYLMWFVDGNNLDVSTEGYPVTVLEKPTGATEYTITTTTLDGVAATEDAPAKFADDAIKFRVTVNCTGGYFADDICGAFFHADGTGIDITSRTYLYAAAGTSDMAEYEMDKIHFTPGSVYYVLASGTHLGRIGNKMYFTVDPLAGVNMIGAENDRSAVSVSQTADKIVVSAPAMIKAVELYSADGGETVSCIDFSDCEATIDVTSLPSGIYIVSVEMQGLPREAVKVIVR